MLKIKDNIDLKELEKFGYKNIGNVYLKAATTKRVIRISEISKEIIIYVLDSSTYSGYKYEGEYKRIIRPYIKDLIKAGLVEKV